MSSRSAGTHRSCPAGWEPAVDGSGACRPRERGCRVAHLLTENRLVEIVGPGGIGKTAVAVAVGRALTASTVVGTDGVWLARLESAVTPDQVLDVLVGAVDGPGGESALFERLKGTSALVILDNCEHVIDAATALAVRLLDAAPGLRILCTSQVPLDVDGEAVFELGPLALSDSVELFTRRATARRLSTRRTRIETRCSTCVAPLMGCRWRSSSPRHEPGP